MSSLKSNFYMDLMDMDINGGISEEILMSHMDPYSGLHFWDEFYLLEFKLCEWHYNLYCSWKKSQLLVL